MARYRKVDVRIWNDEKFRALTVEAKLIFLHILTHPNMTGLGALRATPGGLADELGISRRRYNRHFRLLLYNVGAKLDPGSALVWLQHWFRYNQPENQNSLKAILKAYDYLPECTIKKEVLTSLQNLLRQMPQTFRDIFNEWKKANKSLTVPRTVPATVPATVPLTVAGTVRGLLEPRAFNTDTPPPISSFLTRKVIAKNNKMKKEMKIKDEIGGGIDLNKQIQDSWKIWERVWREVRGKGSPVMLDIDLKAAIQISELIKTPDALVSAYKNFLADNDTAMVRHGHALHCMLWRLNAYMSENKLTPKSDILQMITSVPGEKDGKK